MTFKFNLQDVRKKPVTVQAQELTKDVHAEMQQLEGGYTTFNDYRITAKQDRFIIETLEGPMQANIGDYLIVGIKGEVYACKPDVFESTYDTVNKASEQDTADRNVLWNTVHNLHFKHYNKPVNPELFGEDPLALALEQEFGTCITTEDKLFKLPFDTVLDIVSKALKEKHNG